MWSYICKELSLFFRMSSWILIGTVAAVSCVLLVSCAGDASHETVVWYPIQKDSRETEWLLCRRQDVCVASYATDVWYQIQETRIEREWRVAQEREELRRRQECEYNAIRGW